MGEAADFYLASTTSYPSPSVHSLSVLCTACVQLSQQRQAKSDGAEGHRSHTCKVVDTMRNLGYALLALCATASAFTSAPHTHPALRRFLSAGQGEVETPSTDSPASSPKRLFVFGLGYVGKELALALTREENGDFYVSGTCTNIQKIEALRQAGVESYLFDAESGRMFQKEAIDDLMNATHVLCTVPPLESDLDPVIQVSCLLRTHTHKVSNVCLLLHYLISCTERTSSEQLWGVS